MTEDMFVNLLFKVASGDPSVALMDKLAGIGAARSAHKQMLKNVSKAQKATGNAVSDLRSQGLVRGQGAQTRYAGPKSNAPGKGPSAGKKLDKLQRTPTKELQAKADDLKAKGVPARKAQNAAGLIPDTPKYSSPEEAWGAKFNKLKAQHAADLREARAFQGKLMDENTRLIRGHKEELGALNKAHANEIAGLNGKLNDANQQISGLNKDLSTARGAFSKQFDLRRQAEGEASRQLARGNRNRNLGIGGTAGGLGLGAGGTALLMKYLGGGAGAGAAAGAGEGTAPAAGGLAGLASNPKAVAGAAGLAGAGLTYAGLGAIPALRKRKALRALAALGGGAGLGYAGWKAAQNGLTNVA